MLDLQFEYELRVIWLLILPPLTPDEASDIAPYVYACFPVLSHSGTSLPLLVRCGLSLHPAVTFGQKQSVCFSLRASPCLP